MHFLLVSTTADWRIKKTAPCITNAGGGDITMISEAANRLAGVVSKVALQKRAVMAGKNALVRMRAALVAAIVVTFAFALSTSARAATITVDSLADTGAPGICVLRDAITAANTMTVRNGCVAGNGNDTINFSVIGTIALAS